MDVTGALWVLPLRPGRCRTNPRLPALELWHRFARSVSVHPVAKAPDGLNERQRRFAEAYARTGNATAAYAEAGYKATGNSAESSASKLTRHPKVDAYVNLIRQQRAKKNDDLWAKAERALHKILDDHESERTIQLGEKSEARLATAGEAARAVDILAKIHGHYAPQKTEVSGPDGGPIQVQADYEGFAAKLKGMVPAEVGDDGGEQP